MKEFIYVSVIGCGYKGHVFGFVLLGQTHFSGTTLCTENLHGNLQRNGATFPSHLYELVPSSSLSVPPLCSFRTQQNHQFTCSDPIRVLYNKPDGLCSAADRGMSLESGPSSCPISCGLGLRATGPVRQAQHLSSLLPILCYR